MIIITKHAAKQTNKHKKCTDHKGIEYESFVHMCKAYDQNPATVISRIKTGASLEYALTKKAGKRINIDPNGIEYPNFKLMCEAHNQNVATVSNKLQKGMSLSEALKTKEKEKVIDHKGNIYVSFNAMCNAYNKSFAVVKDRLSRGFSLEDALTKPVKNIVKKETTDYKGVKYKSFNIMCKDYNTNFATIRKRLSKGMSLKEALTFIPKQRYKQFIPGIDIEKHIENIDGIDYYEVIYENTHQIWTFDMLMDYYRNKN